jgi:hypothetical protein
VVFSGCVSKQLSEKSKKLPSVQVGQQAQQPKAKAEAIAASSPTTAIKQLRRRSQAPSNQS